MTNLNRSARRFKDVAFPLVLLLTAGARPAPAGTSPSNTSSPRPKPAPISPAAPAKAVFAGGCFWCEEATFEGKPGVLAVVSGFAGGMEPNPTYEQVSAGRTGHAESVEVTYDPKATTYEALLDIYWHNIDPTQPEAQFCDHGHQYRSAIFYSNEAQHRAALATKAAIERSRVLKKPIVTEIAPLPKFWPAEEYHQDYYKKNPIEYQAYRTGCGRDRALRAIWGAKSGGH